MKKLSIKVKLTLLYTFFMTLISVVALGILFSISNTQILASVQRQLEESVEKGFRYVEWDDGELEIDSDIMEVENNIYLSVYDKNGQLIYGRIPYDFNLDIEIQNQQLRNFTSNGTKWYVFDSTSEVFGYEEVTIRGIVSVTNEENNFAVLIKTSVVGLPLLVLLTAIIGYRFTSRALKPVDNMIKAVQDICENEDLSKRVSIDFGQDEIHRLGLLFNQMLTQLEEVFEREKRFTSDVSHELRTPITVILSHCEALLEEDTLQEEERKEIEVIEKKARNMAQLVSQILMLSRADRECLPVNLEEIDISELTEMVAEEQEEIASLKNISIQTEIEKNIIACVDETLMIRLWVNLISNAISYGREGGYVKVRLFTDGKQITGQVEDNGIGISNEHLAHIWERFYRVDQARTAGQESSSGLGLPMVKWIVKAHGGTIFVSSEEGKGTIFTFHLPGSNES